MLKTVFKNIDDALSKDTGCNSELDRLEQTSWALFLKYISDLEKDKKKKRLRRGRPIDQS